MGNKVSPIGLRIGINKDWKSRWFVDPRDYAKTLHEDLAIRKKIHSLPETKGSEISEIEIIRHPQRVTVVIHTARPGVLIGVKGANIELIGNELTKMITKKVNIKIKEIKKADTNAQVVAISIARQMENRGSFRKAMKMGVSGAIRGGAQGCKIRLSGRLGGADMSRTEEHKEGRVPLHTLRADIDYGFYEAQTTFGKIGVKVWIYQGMVYKQDKMDDAGQLLRKPRGVIDTTEEGGEREHHGRSERPARDGERKPATARPRARAKPAEKKE